MKKVKSMQMFRKPTKQIAQGDRAGICVTQFDPKKMERGVVCTPGFLPTLYGGVVRVNNIPYYKGRCVNKAKFHITVGHETVMGKLQFFGCPPENKEGEVSSEQFNVDTEYSFHEELHVKKKVSASEEQSTDNQQQFVIVEFDHPIVGRADSLIIGSRLDTDINLNACRLAFHGRIVMPFLVKEYAVSSLPLIKIFKWKQKEGTVERMSDAYTVIVKSLFKKETNLALFTNMKVTLSTGEQGLIEGSFGQSGKIKVRVPNGLNETTMERLSTTKKGKNKQVSTADSAAGSGSSETKEPIKVLLEFKKFIYDISHKMVQS